MIPPFFNPRFFSPEVLAAMREAEIAWQRRIEAMSAAMQEAAKSVERTVAALEPAAASIGQRGWTIPSWGDFHTVREMAQLAAEELDTVMLREYTKNESQTERELLRSLTSNKPLLRWRPLLEEGAYCYQRGKYRVVIPSLISIIEGAVVSEVSLQSRKSKPLPVARRIVSGRDRGMIRAAWVSVEAFLTGLFADHLFDADRPLQLNRHWILHGRDAPEWTRVDCLRLFHALDTISMIAGARP